MSLARLTSALALVTLFGFQAHAHAEPLRVDRAGDPVRVDGSLREWSAARFSDLGGSGRGLRYALASDARGLYLAAEVDDDALVRKTGVAPGQDALVLTVVDGVGKGARTREVWLYPGQAGRSKAQAAVSSGGAAKPAAEPRIKVVEGPREDGEGYALEAYIPFDQLLGAELWERGRAALRFEDVDPSGQASIGTADGAELAPFALGEGQNDFIASFAEAKRVSVTPLLDLTANLAGDKKAERLVQLDKYLVAYGSGVQHGDTFVYFELPVANVGAVEDVSLVDFDNDGHAEIVLRLVQKNELGTRTLYTVLAVRDTQMERVFSAEIAKTTSASKVENAVEVRDVGKARRLKLSLVAAPDVTPFAENASSDAVPILTPWGSVKARSYVFDGARFTMQEETKQVPKLAAPSEMAPVPVFTAARGESHGTAAIEPSHADVLAHFKRAAKLPEDAQPSRAFHTNLVGESGDETLYVFGAVLVALGPDVGHGLGYAAYGLPVPASGVKHVGVADVTGDGRAEMFVRVSQPLTGADGVVRELLLVLQLDVSAHFVRAVTREVNRRAGDKLVENRVCTKDGTLFVEATRAVGWNKGDYPFGDEATGGAEPLLLPWNTSGVPYRVEGGRLVAGDR